MFASRKCANARESSSNGRSPSGTCKSVAISTLPFPTVLSFRRLTVPLFLSSGHCESQHCRVGMGGGGGVLKGCTGFIVEGSFEKEPVLSSPVLRRRGGRGGARATVVGAKNCGKPGMATTTVRSPSRSPQPRPLFRFKFGSGHVRRVWEVKFTLPHKALSFLYQ